MEAKVYGTFTKKNDYIYRTDTYMQFGDSNKIIGCCVLCNPGSSELADKTLQARLEQGGDCKFAKYEVTKDDTMVQLEKILIESYGNEIRGKFLIYNTFTLRNSNMDDAIKNLTKTNINKGLLFKDFKDFKCFVTNSESVPELLIGWGCKKNSNLNIIKKEWLEFINEQSISYIGNEGTRQPHYYHPLPRIVESRIKYRESIVEKYKKLIENKIRKTS